jgi:hypothetical protein
MFRILKIFEDLAYNRCSLSFMSCYTFDRLDGFFFKLVILVSGGLAIITDCNGIV